MSDFAIEHGYADYSDAELLEQARGNAQALILATVAFLDAMLTNLRALGAEVVESELGVGRAEATTAGFPDPELCELFGIDPARAAVFHEAAAAIAAPRGLRWTWDVEPDGATRYVVERVGEG